MSLPNVHHSRHPLIAHKISLLRSSATPSRDVRALMHEIGVLLMYEATASLPLIAAGKGQGPLAAFDAVRVDGDTALVPILRAGLSLLQAGLDMLPSAVVLHLGLYREKVTLQPVEYYNKLPAEPTVSRCIVLDPMIATSGTVRAAVQILQDWGIEDISVVCVLASKQGLERFAREFPRVQVHVGVVDDVLSENGFVVPGIGDAGDRLYKTLHTEH